MAGGGEFMHKLMSNLNNNSVNISYKMYMYTLYDPPCISGLDYSYEFSNLHNNVHYYGQWL